MDKSLLILRIVIFGLTLYGSDSHPTSSVTAYIKYIADGLVKVEPLSYQCDRVFAALTSSQTATHVLGERTLSDCRFCHLNRIQIDFLF